VGQNVAALSHFASSLFSNQNRALEMSDTRNGAFRYFRFACCRADIYRFPVISGEPDMFSEITRKRMSATHVNADPRIRRPYRMPVCARYRNPERRQARRRGSLEQRRQHPQTPRIPFNSRPLRFRLVCLARSRDLTGSVPNPVVFTALYPMLIFRFAGDARKHKGREREREHV